MTATSFQGFPRPGLMLGRYPERQVPRAGKLDEFFDRTAARLTSRWGARASCFDRVLSGINLAGSSLSALSEDELSNAVAELRVRLVRAGWNDAIAIEAFALIREMATRVLGMRHYDSQLLGGWVMYQGQVAEMQTGEGKTLSATLPAATAALAGVPVHIITANDYLALRDAELMRPLYDALGLTVGVVCDGMGFSDRRSAYACDITYTTNKQICFDYLRDRVERGSNTGKLYMDMERLGDSPSRCERLMLRGLCFAIIDEADSVLIDEARTPLVLSGAIENDAAQQLMYQQALMLADELTQGDHFELCEGKRGVNLTLSGSEYLTQLVMQMNAQWSLLRRREELVLQALTAQHLFIRDRDYIVCDSTVKIVDGNTGRIMSDYAWTSGLHQMVEAKEQCALSGDTQTLARLTYQRFFRRYLKLSGMTGTASEVEAELSKVYGLNVTRVAPNHQCRRVAMPERFFVDAEHALTAVIASACEHAKQGRPVLIGTRSVLMSGQYAQRLAKQGIVAQVLNASQDAQEADIIAQAGKVGQITVATNMAGRGTDIQLASGVEELGGLHVIVTERNDSRRVDRQLVGRCARQGDPGSYQVFSSLDDDVPRQVYHESVLRLFSQLALGSSVELPHWLGRRVLNHAQRRIELNHERIRRRVERDDERLNSILSFSGACE